MTEANEESMRDNDILDKAMVVELEIKQLGGISELESTKLCGRLDVWSTDGIY